MSPLLRARSRPSDPSPREFARLFRSALLANDEAKYSQGERSGGPGWQLYQLAEIYGEFGPNALVDHPLIKDYVQRLHEAARAGDKAAREKYLAFLKVDLYKHTGRPRKAVTPEKVQKEKVREQIKNRQETYRRRDKEAEKKLDQQINEDLRALPQPLSDYGKDWQKRRVHEKRTIEARLVQALKSRDPHTRNAANRLKRKYRRILND